MPPLSRNAPKLLSHAGGKAHASSEDHEEDIMGRYRPGNKMTEEQLNADPISSSDECEIIVDVESQDTPRASQTSTTSTPRRTKMKKKSADTKAKPVRTGTRQSKRDQTRIQPPSPATSKARAIKSGTSMEEEKEKSRGLPNSSAEKRPAAEQMFGWGYGQSKRPRVAGSRATYGSKQTTNIHAQADKGKAAAARKPKSTVNYSKKERYQPIEERGEDSDCSTKEVDKTSAELDALNDAAKKKESKEFSQLPSSPVKAPRPDLLASLGAYKQPESSPPDAENEVYDVSSAPASSQAPIQDRDTLANLEEHVANLPQEDDQDSVCPLCQESVDPDHSAEFWKAHRKTVRNQSLFCKEHNIRAAKTRYRREGFPTINWDNLQSRIRKLKPQLVKLLRNETGMESKYRKQHAAKLLSGKAAVVPVRRKGQKLADVEKQLKNFDNMPASTGYYGPRGRRIMMETVTSNLSDVIRKVSINDPVVGRSGFAVYMQAVLVPELTVLLVKEDFDVSEGMAEELIEKSADLGALLHEDFDDKVEAGSDEEEDREMLDLDDDEKYEASADEVTVVKERRTRTGRDNRV
ncbi:hypothetical protein CC80DRAFT_598921 [Byssothecium circinans]|uniref:Restriction of telomere capping protein 4 n=1 Tax=Byssothecium circinans TaxID=147558 RepID=A0A6A5TCL6_9PLEO|nr:hypothetical protein CC80DRAFT_598921 [Byssothecium circinans]